jgi:hypothetical protein
MARNTFHRHATRQGGLHRAACAPSQSRPSASRRFGGYNLCYGKEGGEVHLSPRQFLAPLAAIGRPTRRVSVLTAEADGTTPDRIAADPMAGTLLSSPWPTVNDRAGNGSRLRLALPLRVSPTARTASNFFSPRPRTRSLPRSSRGSSVLNRDGGPPVTRSRLLFLGRPRPL